MRHIVFAAIFAVSSTASAETGFVEESLSYLDIVGHKDGYEARVHAVVGGVADAPASAYRVAWKSGGKTVATIKCDVGKGHHGGLSGQATVAMCTDRDHHLTAKGPIEADLIFTEDGKDRVLRTWKTTVAKFTSFGDPVWQVVPDDLLASAWELDRDGDVYHGGMRPHFRMWVARKLDGIPKLQMHCTVGGAAIDDLDVQVNDIDGSDVSIQADTVTKDGKHTLYVWSVLDFAPDMLIGAKEGAKTNLPYLADHNGKWDCQIRHEGKAIRELLFTVADGMVQPDPLQQGKGATPTLPNVRVIDVRIPKDAKFDVRVRTDALRKSRGYGLAWPEAANVKAIQAAFPPSSGLPDPK